MILLLDNNVVIDFLIRREPFFALSNKVFTLGVLGEFENYLTVIMLSDIYYILQKDFGADKAQDMIEENLRYLNLVSVSGEDVRWCLQQRWEDFEDCLVARCAENIKADFIITRDKAGFKKSLVPALSPQELFDLLEARGITYQEIDCNGKT